MITLLLLSNLLALYVLILIPNFGSMLVRLLAGLVITWPLLTLYVVLDGPPGIPDLMYERAYVLAMVLFLCMAIPLQQFAATIAANGRSIEFQNMQYVQPFTFGPVGRPNWMTSLNRYLPLPVTALLITKLVATVAGVIRGEADSTAIAAYLDSCIVTLVIYVLIKQYVNTRKELGLLLTALVISSLVVFVSGVYERVLDLTESAFPNPGHTEEGDTRVLDVPGGRAAGIAGNPAVYGAILGVGMVICLAVLADAKSTVRKMLLWTCVLLLGYGIAVSFTRGAWLAVGLTTIMAQFYFSRHRLMFGAALALCGLVLVAVWGGIKQSELVQDRVLNEENVSGRFERIVWSAQQVVHHPFLGTGRGGLNAMIKREFPVDGFDTSHNSYMTMLVDEGIFVFAAFLALFSYWLLKAKKAIWDPNIRAWERNVVVAMAAILCTRLILGMSLELSYFNHYTAIYWIAGAIIERIARGLENVGPEVREVAPHAI
ncbi:MAG: O-antigen ligase family protein [Pirellulaceae bacterium]|nr:O-antigen ligase family protein [Pirellulaceae bacterium]